MNDEAKLTTEPVAWQYLCGEVWVLSGVPPTGIYKDCPVRPLYLHPPANEATSS